MLSITLADIIDTQDPCTPGSPSYATRDPEVCALLASTVAADTGPSGEMAIEDPSLFQRTCASGYTLTNVGCVPTTLSPVGPATAPGAASLAGFGWKTALFLGVLGALGTGAYFLHKHYIKA